MTPSQRDPTLPLFGYAPGTAAIVCTCCRAVADNVDPRAIQCHACACKLLDYRCAGIETGEVPRQDWWDKSAPLNPALENMVRRFADRLNGAAPLAPDEAKSLDTTPRAPKVGQRVDISGRKGVVCAPDDPGRTGTYKSAKYGDIPIRMLGNRKQRRADAARARQ